METVSKRDKLHTGLVTGVIWLAFLGMFMMMGYGGAGDTDSYLTMGITREPLYPLLLWIFRQLFGENGFYVQLALLQNGFAAVSTCILAVYLGRRIFSSNWGKWLSACILLLPYLMTPLFSRTHLVMANKVMAEGITLPGYYLFVLFLLKLIYEKEHRVRNLCAASGITLVLILSRGQLLSVIVILGITLAVILIRERSYRKLWMPVLLIAAIYLTSSLLTGWYNYCNSAVFTGTASSKPMILANALYVSEPEDGADITDPDRKALFDRTYAALDEQQMLAKYASGSLVDKALYHEQCHDSISFDYFELIKNDIYVDRMGDNYTEYMLFQDNIASILTKELLRHNYGRYLQNYIAVCTLGFIRSIAVENSLLNIYALLAYLSGIVLMALTWKKKGFTNALFFFMITYVMIISFVMSTSLILQCITRYMIYNLPFFYIGGMALLNSMRKDKNNGI